MTIAKTGSESSSAGDGVSVAFSFPFRFFEDTDLKVYIVVDATNVSTLQTLTTHYAIVNNGDETGGTITMVTAPVSGETLLIQRIIPKTQGADYAANDAFPAETHEAALDRLTLLTQENESGHITFPDGDDSASILDSASSRASRIQGYDANGNLLTYSVTPIFTVGDVLVYDTVATLLASTEASRGTGAIWEGGGFRYIEVASGGDITNSAGTPVQLDVLPTSSGYLNVKAFGAVGDDVIDDTAAINAAIAAAEERNRGSVVYFPAGVYRTTSTLLIDTSGVELRGVNEKGATSFSPAGFAGAMIRYDATDSGPIVQIGDNVAFQFHNKISHLRIGATIGLTPKPIGIQLNAASEFTLENFHVNSGCSVGLEFNACFIGRVDNFDIAANDVGIKFLVNTALSSTKNSDIWFRQGNIWDSADDAVQIVGDLLQVIFNDTWIEFADNIFHFKQETDSLLVAELTLEGVRGSVGGGGPSNSRFIRGTAFAGGSNSLQVTVRASNCITFNSSSTFNIEYTKGTNTGGSSHLDQCVFDNCTFYGSSTGVVTSDTALSTVFFTGNTKARDAFGAGPVIPLVGGLAKQHNFQTAFGYWDMVGSHPIRLPTISPLSFGTDGQIYFDTGRNRIPFTANGNRVFLPRPLTTTYGDEAISVNVSDDAETLRFNTALTTGRLITVSSTNAYNGAKFRVVRTSAATGASTLNVGGLKSLAVSEWCDIEHDGTSWRLTAFGGL